MLSCFIITLPYVVVRYVQLNAITSLIAKVTVGVNLISPGALEKKQLVTF